MRTLKAQCRNLKAVEGNLTSQLTDLRDRLTMSAHDVKTERETIVRERDHHTVELNSMKKTAGTQLARAQNSEVGFREVVLSGILRMIRVE